MAKLISVIVPVCNVEKCLARCVDSLIGQTYRDIEIILIDDGSADQSGKICDEYQARDPRIRVLHQEYSGVSDARNRGLELSRGEYIVFLDGDDEAASEYVEKLYRALTEHDLDIAQCCLLRVRDGEPANKQDVKEGVRICSGMEMQMRIFDRDRYFSMCLCGKLFKKSLFDGLKFPSGRINEDESLIYLLMYRSERVGIMDDYLYFYHYNRESITEKRYNIHRLDCFYMLEEKFAFYKERHLDALANKTANEYFSQMSVVFNHPPETIDHCEVVWAQAKKIYLKDRKIILETSRLAKSKWIFMKLSYVSFDFVKLYGKLLTMYLSRKSH